MQAKIYNSAIRALARREHSTKELTDKLSAKGYPLPEIQELLILLKAENLQSDQRFMESLIRYRSSQGKGPVRIAQELSEHGFPRDEIQAALKAAQVCWASLASQVRTQRFGEDLPTHFPDKAKQLRFLQYRGFNQDQIKAAFKD